MHAFDYGLFLAINGWAAQGPVRTVLAIFLARWLIFVLVGLVIAVGVYAVLAKKAQARQAEVVRDLALFYRSSIAVLGGLLDSLVISLIIFRSRPFVTQSGAELLIDPPLTIKSFPSDHTTMAFALAVSVFMLNRRLGAVLLVGAFGVALGRIMVGVHYPLDVFAGALLGSAWAWIVALIAEHWRDREWITRQLADKVETK